MCGISPSSEAAWRWQATQRVRTDTLSPAVSSCQNLSPVRISNLFAQGSKPRLVKQILLSQLALNPLGHLSEVMPPPLIQPSAIVCISALAFQYCSFMKFHVPFSCVFELIVFCMDMIMYLLMHSRRAAVANVLHFVPACGSNHCLPQPGLSARWNL